jgi:hypothetical protein
MTTPTSRTITAEQLIDAGATEEVVTAFTNAFGSSADISPDFVRAHVDSIDWATMEPVLTTHGKALYERSIQVADAAYGAVVAEAQATYDATIAQPLRVVHHVKAQTFAATYLDETPPPSPPPPDPPAP